MRTIGLILAFAAASFAADNVTARSLTDLSKKPNAPEFKDALVKALTDRALDGGTAWMGEGPDFIWAVRTPGANPSLEVDGKPRPAMKKIAGTDIWFATGTVTPVGKLHFFEYKVNGRHFGGSAQQAANPDTMKTTEFPAFGPDSYSHPGVPQGRLSEKLTFTSKIYEGMTNDYWVYVPAQYDPATPAALMVWQDGQMYNERDKPTNRTLDVLDNLTAQKKIPVMIGVFISPGTLSNPESEMYKTMTAGRGGKGGGRGGRGAPAAGAGPRPVALRSVQYDTVDDRYAKYLRDELLPEVYKNYNIRRDAYSRAITGLSSGGICALNVAWQQPDQFSRVITWIGSYTSIQWHSNQLDGGEAFPPKVRREQKRNIRIWLQDGSNDLENNFGSWPLQAIQMANSFKMKDYDFHFSFGGGTHNPSQGSAEFPAEMIWLWRDYDPAKTEQTFTIDEAEKSKPYYRVVTLNRPTD
ncbi:MAG: alpha/beta hydrolase-fold protein [Terriglobia bacterium]